MKTFPLLTAVLLAFAGQTLAATTVVDFALDANSVNSNTNFLRGSGSDTSWSLTDELSDATLYANAPTNAVFYGGYASAGGRPFNIEDDASNGDYLGLNVLAGSNDDYVGAFMWQKADFLAGTGQQLDIDSTSRFTADIGSLNASNDARRPGYSWMFLQDSTVYVSDVTLFGNNDPNPFSIDSGDLTALNWFSVDLASSMTAAPVAATPDFTDIEGVGIYFTTADSDSGNARDSQLYAFNADITVIPEPRALPLFALGMASLLLLRRRRAAPAA